jgi:NAD(P)-dependent dehydrogenase (short-subunit alcohol dehydrogenase family)
MDPRDHAAVVTGGASGLGEETAIRLARAGAKVAVLDLNGEAARKAASTIGGIGIECDVSDPDSATAALTKARDQHGPARIIINCAGRGVIISTASIAAFEGQIGQAAYAASKGGVAALTVPAAREFGQFGIRVLAIAPGLFETPMLLGLPAEVQESLAASIPFPRQLGRPRQYAELVLHCIQNTYLNGEVIRLDGALRLAPR